MATLRDWLVQSRVHTASLTVPGTLLGLAAAGDWEPLHWVVFGAWALLFHGVGFLHNGLTDYQADRDDPSKQHFPLISRRIGLPQAWLVWFVGLIVGLISGAMLASGRDAAILALLVATGAGYAYNVLSKRWAGSPLLISISFAALPAFAYFSVRSDVNAAIVYIVSYAFLLMMTQISVSGYLKDLGVDKVNWLKSWGAVASPHDWVPRYWDPHARCVGTMPTGTFWYDWDWRVAVWMWTSRSACLVLAFAWVLQSKGISVWPLLIGTVVALVVVTFWVLTVRGPSLRKRKVAWMGVNEVLVYYLLVLTLQPILGQAAIYFLVLPIVWYMALNHVMWGHGHLLGPKV